MESRAKISTYGNKTKHYKKDFPEERKEKRHRMGGSYASGEYGILLGEENWGVKPTKPRAVLRMVLLGGIYVRIL